MEENNKINNEYSTLSSSYIKNLKSSKKNHLSHILLKSNRKKIKNSLKVKSSKKLNSPLFPLIPNPQQVPYVNKEINEYNNYNDLNISRNEIPSDISKSNTYHLEQLLLNSISFDNYQKALMDLKTLRNSKKDALPPIIPEEKKDSDKNMDSLLNELNSSIISKNNPINSNKLLKKKYSFVWKTLCDIKVNKRCDLSKLKEYNKESIYNISKTKILKDIILNEYNDNEMNYEEQKILGDYKYYNNWIKKKLLELKKEIPPEERVHRTLEKEYKNSKYNKPLLTLNSLSISFNCKGKYHLFHIPFEYMPLFYYKNMSYLKYILVSIFKFDNDFEDINIDFDEIIYILSCSQQFEIKENEVIEKMPRNSINEFQENQNSEMDFIPISKHGKKHKKKNNNQENIVAPKTKKIKKIKEEEKNLYKCKYNKILFKWNTPKYNYDITVKVPEAIFQVGKIVLKTYINIELIFYLLENKFEDWDFYISQYIFSYKEYLKKIGNLISVKSMENLFSNKNKILPILENSLNSKDLINKKIDNLNTEKICQISEKSKKYEFIYTDENNINYIKIFHNFLITARCKTFIKNKFCFDFNFSHMRILNKILRIQGLNFFLKKLIWVERETLSIYFKYDALSALANGEYKLLEKHDPNLVGAELCLRMKERDKDIINISISFPSLETVKYNNLNYENCFESDYDNVILTGIPLDTLDELCKKDFIEWPEILMKNK